jgi:hypothetical protein
MVAKIKAEQPTVVKNMRPLFRIQILPKISVVLVFLSVLLVVPTIHAFGAPQSIKRPGRNVGLSMIGSFLAGGTSSGSTKSSTELPRDVKDAVSKCRAAVQQALGDRCSRIDIEMPVGAKFGVEKTPGKKQKATQMDGPPTRDMLDTSNRELARLFVDMFQPVGGDNIAVVFNEQGLADAAKKKWKGDPTAASRIMAINRKKGSPPKSKKSKGMGFAAKLAAEVEDDGTPSGPFDLLENTEVALFVAPGPKELATVERICNQVGMGTLVILVNARLGLIEDKFPSSTSKDLFQQEFESVFSLTAAPQEEAPGCLLYRMYPSDWVLARKPKIGSPKPILTQSEKPSRQDCQEAFDSLEIGEMEKGVENVLENVANWFN